MYDYAKRKKVSGRTDSMGKYCYSHWRLVLFYIIKIKRHLSRCYISLKQDNHKAVGDYLCKQIKIYFTSDYAEDILM